MALAWTRSSASGVTSRPVTPVPPVEITQSTSGSSIQACSAATIVSASSRRILRSARIWPALAKRATSVSPERSSASVRVAEPRRTAMRTGRNAALASIGTGDRRGGAVGTETDGGRARQPREARPQALRQCAAARRGAAAGLALVHPVIAQHGRHIPARFPIRDRFDVEQRVAAIAHLRVPQGDRGRAGVISRDYLGQEPTGERLVFAHTLQESSFRTDVV